MERNQAPFYVMASAANAGTSIITAALIYGLKDAGYTVGIFRPVNPIFPASVIPSEQGDPMLQALTEISNADLTYQDCTGVNYLDLLEDRNTALSTIISRFDAIQAKCDIVVVLGSDYSTGMADEFDLNGQIAMNLGARLLLVESLRDRDVTTLRSICFAAVQHLRKNHQNPAALIVNRIPADGDNYQELAQEIRDSFGDALNLPVLTTPEIPLLHAPTVSELQRAVNATPINDVDPELLNNEALAVTVAGVTSQRILDHISEDSIVVVPADRESTIATLLANQDDPETANIVGIIWTASVEPTPEQLEMAKANTQVPILSTQLGTYATATTIDNTRGVLRTSATHKLAKAQEFATDWFDATPLDDLLATPAPTSVTPQMFQYQLLQRAKADKKHIVLPEGDDDRILEAADIILHEGFADLTILGDPDSILTRAKQLGLDLSAATLLDPAHYDGLEEFAETYFQLRKHKGISIDDAREKMKDISYFATMMVHLGKADGMVSGAAHTTAHTIRPSFEIIKTKPGVATVSSIFLMCLEDHVLAFGDCAVNIDPTPAQLADIAISSAETASQFGVEPRVALLSYSTGTSGSGADVDKVCEAVAIVKDSDMPYPVDGPIQFDAAVDATVGAAKAPDSVVAGRATVLVFPDLNTGNNTYKAVQRTAGAVAVGPILQGLKKPINDLSRGALVEDIVNTVAVTATQAQSI